MTKKKLTIVITRPQKQSEILADRISNENLSVLILPSIQITATDKQKNIKDACQKELKSAIVIFTSVHAVDACAKYLTKNAIPKIIIAIGSSTAKKLQEVKKSITSLPKIIIPKTWSSEGILQLKELQELHQQKCIIFTTKNPRKLLATELNKRGAEVINVESYQQQPLHEQTLHLWQKILQSDKPGIDYILFTSCNSIEVLLKNLSCLEKQRLISIPIITTSPRITDYAKNIGYDNIIAAENAENQTVIRLLNRLSKT